MGCGQHVESPRSVCNATGMVTVAGAPAAGVYVYLSEIENAKGVHPGH